MTRIKTNILYMEIYFWILSLLIPAAMILIGIVFIYRPPKKINSFYGYRTARSMASQQAWDASHSISGSIYIKTGLAAFIVIAVLNLLMPFNSAVVTLIDSGLALACVILPVFYVEKKLKQMFRENNNGQ